MRLRLVGPGEELTGILPPRVERLARTARPASDAHRGLIFLAATLARHGLRRALPPSARRDLLDALDSAELWAHQPAADTGALREQRSRCFEALPATEQKTIDAIRQSRTHLAEKPETPLDAHAEHTVERFVRLGAYYAASGVLLVLDGIDAAAQTGAVIPQVAGAIAYQQVGFGAARANALRRHAIDQARWETERLRAPHDGTGLALQIWHEYLGVRWKAHYEQEIQYLADFAVWAVGSAR